MILEDPCTQLQHNNNVSMVKKLSRYKINGIYHVETNLHSQ